MGHGNEPESISIEDTKNKQIERRDVSCKEQSIVDNQIPIKEISPVEEQLTPNNYVTFEKLIVPKIDKRKNNSNTKSIFKAVKRIKI